MNAWWWQKETEILFQTEIRSMWVLTLAIVDFFFPSIFFFPFFFFLRLIALQYCISFAIRQHESATIVHIFPVLNPPQLLILSLLFVFCCSCSVSGVQLFVTPWIAGMSGYPVLHYFPKLAETNVHWVSDTIYLVLCYTLLLLPWIFPSFRVFSNESALWIR